MLGAQGGALIERVTTTRTSKTGVVTSFWSFWSFWRPVHAREQFGR